MIVSRKVFQIVVGTIFGSAVAFSGIKSVMAPPNVKLDMSTLKIIDATSDETSKKEEKSKKRKNK
jgi:hypothetical protein